MKNGDLIDPKEAAERLGISLATITRCVKRGAPVHRWGSTGRRYRLDVDEFRRWMERQGQEERAKPTVWPGPAACFPDVDELARRRRASVRAV